MLQRLTLLLISSFCMTSCLGVFGQESAERDHFESSIRPLLISRCIECHGPDRQESSLRLDSRPGWMKGGEGGPAIIPGDPENSLLLTAVKHENPDLQMPEEKLSQTEIAAIEQWILSGAFDPRETADGPAKHVVSDPRTFWSFQPIREVNVPATSDPNWIRTPVDAFILAQLDASGLTPTPQANPRTLIRRAYFDLIGLPPTPEQVDAFVREPTQDAWARLINQLLDSPQYGERWGRHWLDVARYADSGGFETDVYYRNAWRYRDYVVKSFNDDKPYNIFVQEQIAGDELWPDDITLAGNYTIAPEKLKHLEALTGTGLYTLGPQVHESNMDGRKIRYETYSDWVDTTGAAFMGLTFGCARCHDHKFDPITQKDYYALQAVFAASREIEYPIIDAMGITDFKQHYPRILAVEESRRALRMFDARMAGKQLSAEEQTERQNLLNAIANNVLALPENTALGVPLVGLMETPTISVLGHERPELVAPVYLLNRGELSRPREVIEPGLPVALQTASEWNEPMPGQFRNRAALAQWLTSEKHPLTARVMVNRIWYGHFGRGIVGSLNDFGQMGERPTHPELLDWLAATFMQRGWSIKEMHRTMMLSSTYQMDSLPSSDANASIDPQNRLFWKMNRRRLEAEALWDSIHAVAGTLNLKMGGRPVVPPLEPEAGAPGYWIVSADPAEHTRRGLYILQRRNYRFPMFDVFDLPVNAVSAPARDVTTVAPQALWMLNNPVALRQAQAFALRLKGESNAGWNIPDFGPRQSGWLGNKSGIHAGWALREDNGHATETIDDPIGTMMTHGMTSVAWKVPADGGGPVEIRGGLWNIRRLGRSGPWKLWHNDQLLSEGMVDDNCGTSAAPLNLSSGSGGEAALNCAAAAGDTFRLEILEDDFVAVRLSFETPNGTRDIATDFSLDANPTPFGWQYCESLANGGQPLTNVVRVWRSGDDASQIERAWQLALGRLPTTEEKVEAEELLKSLSEADPQSAMSLLCLALFNMQEFAYVD
ncbi:MAG: PSD1 domain-containing protein [Planctomyces sp.]|nr:PSD1 domain-containing protein [Planctomyces sp.]